MAEGSAGSEVPDNNVIAAATDKTKFWFDDEGDVDVDDLSFREIMNRAKALNARAEEDLKAGRFEKADRPDPRFPRRICPFLLLVFAQRCTRSSFAAMQALGGFCDHTHLLSHVQGCDIEREQQASDDSTQVPGGCG
eukprot:669998-Rhodomonas_salina.2